MRRAHLTGTLIALLVGTVIVAAFGLVGCSASQLSSADSAIGGTPLAPTTAPTSQPGLYSTVQPTNAQLTLHLVQDATGEAAPIVAAAAPAPWGAIASGVLLLVSSVLGVFATKQTSRANTAESVIAAAAPGVYQLVKQTTDNQTLATDVQEVADVAPGVISLLTHPTAKSVLQATGTLINSLATPPSTLPRTGSGVV